MVSIKASYRRLISKSRERQLIDLLPTRVVAGRDQSLHLLKKAKTSSNPCRGLQHFYQYPGELASPKPPSLSPDRKETKCRRIVDLFQPRAPLKRAREPDDELEFELPSREEAAWRLSNFFASLHVPLEDYRAIQSRLMAANVAVQSQMEQLVQQQHDGECLVSQTKDLVARAAEGDELLQKAQSRLNTLERSNQALQDQLQELRHSGDNLHERLSRELRECEAQLDAKHDLLQEAASRLDTSELNNAALEHRLRHIQEARGDPLQQTSSGVTNTFLHRMTSYRTKSKTSTLLKKLVTAKSPSKVSGVSVGKVSER